MSMKKIVLFAGTTEGHRLCECFVQNKWQAEVFVATEYGREILPQAPNLHIHAGRLLYPRQCADDKAGNPRKRGEPHSTCKERLYL